MLPIKHTQKAIKKAIYFESKKTKKGIYAILLWHFVSVGMQYPSWRGGVLLYN